MPRPRSSWARSGGATSGSTTAPTTAHGARRTSKPARGRRRARRSARRDRHEETVRFGEDQFRSMVEHGPAVIYIDAADECGLIGLHQPADRATARVHAAGVAMRTTICGPRSCIPTTRPAPWPRTPGTTRPASRSRWSTACSTRTARSCGSTTRRRWSGTNAAWPRFSHGVMMDISDRKRGEEDVAFHGLPRRAHRAAVAVDVRGAPRASLARARRHEGSVAVVVRRCRRLPLVNDSLGHAPAATNC